IAVAEAHVDRQHGGSGHVRGSGIGEGGCTYLLHRFGETPCLWGIDPQGFVSTLPVVQTSTAVADAPIFAGIAPVDNLLGPKNEESEGGWCTETHRLPDAATRFCCARRMISRNCANFLPRTVGMRWSRPTRGSCSSM